MMLVIEHNRSAVAVGELASGDGGVAQTVAAIQAIIDHATYRALRVELAAIAAAIANGESPRQNPKRFADRLFYWLRQRVRFERDPDGIEFIRHPATMLEAIAQYGVALGDCDDLATLAASIIAAAGLRPVLVTVGRRKPGRFEHIFLGVRLSDATLDRATVYPLDPQELTAPGEWPTYTPRVQLWSVTPSPFYAPG